jgi:chorismate dehydratase
VTRARFGVPAGIEGALFAWRLGEPPWSDRVEVTYDQPARLASRLARGELDLALVPSSALFAIAGATQLVPGLAVTTTGAASLARLDHGVALGAVQRVATLVPGHAADTLVAVLFRASNRSIELSTSFGDLRTALTDHDAAIIAGDAAVLSAPPAGAQSVDLARAWSELTGAPMVWWVCAARPGVVDRRLYATLHAARARARRELTAVAEQWSRQSGGAASRFEDVFRGELSLRLGRREFEGLKFFFDAAAKSGLIDRPPALQFAPLAEANACVRFARRLKLSD